MTAKDGQLHRQQWSYDKDDNSDSTAHPGGGDSLTRQEYKDEADINNIVRRFGVDSFARQPIFGQVDFDRGLQEAFADIATANELFRTLPPELRDKYPTRGKLIEGMDNGNFATDLTDALRKRNAPNLSQELTWLKETLTGLKSSTSGTTGPATAAADGSATGTAPNATPPSKPTST